MIAAGKSITGDNGSEFANLSQIESKGIPYFYFLLFYGSSVPVSLGKIRFTSIFRDKNITPLKREKTR